MYQDYTSLLEDLNRVESQYAKATILNIESTELSIKQKQLTYQLQQLSDAMTFPDPLLWIQYKYYAYQDEAQPITTMHDFRIHCSKPGYICTKRFEFLNRSLINYGCSDLNSNQAYDDMLELSQLFKNKSLNRLLEDELFMNEWKSYEYYKEEGRVAKWQNFA